MVRISTTLPSPWSANVMTMSEYSHIHTHTLTRSFMWHFTSFLHSRLIYSMQIMGVWMHQWCAHFNTWPHYAKWRCKMTAQELEIALLCVTYKYCCRPCAWSLFILAGTRCLFIKAIGQLLGVRENLNLFSEKMPMFKASVALTSIRLIFEKKKNASMRGDVDKTVFCSPHTITPTTTLFFPPALTTSPKKSK